MTLLNKNQPVLWMFHSIKHNYITKMYEIKQIIVKMSYIWTSEYYYLSSFIKKLFNQMLKIRQMRQCL